MLKHKHRIYKHDFESRLMFAIAIDKKYQKVVVDLEKFKFFQSNIERLENNSRIVEELQDELDEIIRTYSRAVDEIEDIQSHLRG